MFNKDLLFDSISNLDIGKDIKNPLKRAGITNIGQVLLKGHTGIVNTKRMGEQRVEELFFAISRYLGVPVENLNEITNSILQNDNLNAQIDKSSLPIRTPIIDINSNSQPNLVKLILPLTKAITRLYNDERGFRFVKYYYGLEGSQKYSLQDIGDAEGLTRERVRQVNERTLLRVRNSLLTGKLEFKNREIPSNLIEEFISLKQSIIEQGDFADFDQLLILVEDRYNELITHKEYNNVKFLFKLFGFKKLPQKVIGYNGSDLNAWELNENVNLNKVWIALKSVYNLLQEVIIPLSLFEIRLKLNRRRRIKIDEEYIKYAIQICPDIEKLDNGLYQINFIKLSSIANQAYRVFFENNKVFHYRDLLKEINHRLAVAGEKSLGGRFNLTNQLASDTRFKPIGKSGQWILSDWDHISTDTTVAIMEEFFHMKKSKATIADIHNYVGIKRPGISKNSIYSYLFEKDEFVKVSQNEYELTSWGTAPYKKVRRQGDVQAILIEEATKLFSNKGINTILQKDLLNYLHDITGASKSTITAWIYRTPLLELKKSPENSRRNLAIFKGTNVKTASKKGWMQIISEEVISYLETKPRFTATIGETAKHVIRKTKCKKQTFYRYLNQIDGVSKEEFGNKKYCYLNKRELSSSKPSLDSAQIQILADKGLKENIIRAYNLLNIDTVDMALFQLGKIFENELKAFLKKAMSVGYLNITSNDLSSLVKMIDCVTREGVIENEKKHYLTFLRQERNERAHGEIPEIEKRKKMMEDAPFLAKLYVDFIIIFYNRRLKIS